MDRYYLFILGSSGNVGTSFIKLISKNKNNDIFEKIFLIDIKFNYDEIPKIISNKCEFLSLDLSSEKETEKIFKKINPNKKNLIINLIAKDYPVNGEFNNNWSSFGPSPSEFQKVFDINLIIPYRISRIIVEKKLKNIRFINIGSIYGIRTPHPEIYSFKDSRNKPSPYSITKAGLISLVKYAALEFKKFGSESYMISFGGIESSLQDKNFIKKYNNRIVSGGLLNIDKATESMLKLSLLPWGTVSGSNFIIDNGYTIF